MSSPVRDRLSKDRLSRKRLSWSMSRIRGKDTKPEKRVHSVLHRLASLYDMPQHRHLKEQATTDGFRLR
jgi:G:T-mismatch repair DNA endonuclease (very short patch repair protein)